ncbi:MAG: hypothetical protein MJ239_00940 [Bacilli bacterium]|nr:hypothetical protein [Bacilli bacterium]
MIRIRHYDENGNAYKDVDYTDHGRPDTHKVPHTHIIEIGEIIDRTKGARSQHIDVFLKLISQGFDVSFNYKDVFYTISAIDERDGDKKYGLGSDNVFTADFESLDSIRSFVIIDKTIEDIVSSVSDNEIFY